jgi:CPA2 family monovalent cation:H+ antiporter-2
MFGYDNRTSLTVAASLAQIGEFSFILAGLGVALQILPEAGRDLILAGAIISILLHPFIFTAVSGLGIKRSLLPVQEPEETSTDVSSPATHYIIVGLGRVGGILAEELKQRKVTFGIIEEAMDVISASGVDPLYVVHGNANDLDTLERAGIKQATLLFLAIPEGFEAGSIALKAKKLNPHLNVFARAHSVEEVRHLNKLGVDQVIMGEVEIARSMIAMANP